MNKEKPSVINDEEFLEWCGSHKVIGCGGTREMKGVDRDVSVCEDCRAQAQYDALVAYYEPLIQQARAKAKEEILSECEAGTISGNDLFLTIKANAKAEVAREMLQDMREHIYWPIPMFEAKWKSKYMEGK